MHIASETAGSAQAIARFHLYERSGATLSRTLVYSLLSCALAAAAVFASLTAQIVTDNVDLQVILGAQQLQVRHVRSNAMGAPMHVRPELQYSKMQLRRLPNLWTHVHLRVCPEFELHSVHERYVRPEVRLSRQRQLPFTKHVPV